MDKLGNDFYGSIGRLQHPVSRIFFGTANSLMQEGKECDDLLDAVLLSGINAFDTARVYLEAEAVLGRWMERRGNRSGLILLSKCAHPSPLRKRVTEKDIRDDFAKSSEALRTDVIDIYLLHRDDPKVPVGDIVQIMNGLLAEGKIRMYGGSNWTTERIEAANEYAYAHNLEPFMVSSPNFGLAEQVKDLWGGGCISISGPQQEAAREWYRTNQMPVIAYSSLGRGLFSGRFRADESEKASLFMDKYAMKGYAYPQNFERLRRCEILAKRKSVSVPQLALKWIFTQELDTYAVVSTTNPERLAQNIRALSISLSKAEASYLNLERENFEE